MTPQSFRKLHRVNNHLKANAAPFRRITSVYVASKDASILKFYRHNLASLSSPKKIPKQRKPRRTSKHAASTGVTTTARAELVLPCAGDVPQGAMAGPSTSNGVFPGHNEEGRGTRSCVDTTVASTRKFTPGIPTQLITSIPVVENSLLQGTHQVPVASSLVDAAGVPSTKVRRPRGRPPKVNSGAEPATSLKATAKPTQRSAKSKQKSRTTPMRWKIVYPPALSCDTMDKDTISTPVPCFPSLRPRAWVSSKEDLLRIIPELSGSKAVNGLTWGVTETPMMVLEDHVAAEWSIDPDDKLRIVDLVLTRDFTIRTAVHAASGGLDITSNPPSVSLAAHAADPSDMKLNLIQDCKEESIDEVSLAMEVPMDLDCPVVCDAPSHRTVVGQFQNKSDTLLRFEDDEHAPPEAEHRTLVRHFKLEGHSFTRPNTPEPQQPLETQDLFDDHLEGANGHPSPEHLPADIKALIDAYVDGVPVVLIIPGTRSPLRSHRLYPYIFLGFYEIIALQETVEDGVNFVTPNSGRFQWRFRLQWSPGGEYLLGYLPDVVSRPWWRSEQFIQPSSPVPQIISTPHYKSKRDAQRQPTSQSTTVGETTGAGQIYACFFPLRLTHVRNNLDGDDMFPEGWHCSACGLLNPHRFFRHHSCRNPSCPGKADKVGYALQLDQVRQPPERMPLAAPQYYPPDSPEPETAADGMQTYDYSSAICGFHKHVFTRNWSSLQDHASKLFESIQTNLVLTRGNSNDPSFSAAIGYDFLKVGCLGSVTPSESRPLTTARDLLVHHASNYCQLSFNTQEFVDVTVLAWAAAGSDRVRRTLGSKEHYLFILCLGSVATVSFRPLSVKRPKPRPGPSDTSSTAHTPTLQTCSEHVSEDKHNVLDQNQRSDPLQVSLVHGDMLLLAHQDVEMSVKRQFPTTIFVFARVPFPK